MTLKWAQSLMLALLCVAVVVGPRCFGARATAAQGTPMLDIADDICRRTNEFRQQQGLPALQTSGFLQTAAVGHSQEMTELDYFSHTSPVVGRTKVKDRLRLAGGTWSACAENIYRSTGIPSEEVAERTVTAWIKSPSHLKNLVGTPYTHVGVGVVQAGETFTITQDFCRP